MRANIGTAERWLRVVIGLVVLGAGIFGNGLGIVSQWIIGLVGLEVFLTGTLGFSPVYKLLHHSGITSHSVSY